jgi:orotate phosphoribosyltransferase-like protein
MSELNHLFKSTHRYLVSYTAYAGKHNEFAIQGEHCRIVSDAELTGTEIAEQIAHHIQEQDEIPVSQVVLHHIGQLA